MLPTDNALPINAKANSLLEQVLTTQLAVLQSLLPLKGWLLGYSCGKRFSVLASTGGFVGVPKAVLTSLTGGQWLPSMDCAVACQSMAGQDGLHSFNSTMDWPALLDEADSPAGFHIVRMVLKRPDSTSKVCLFGLSDFFPCSGLEALKEQISSCLDAMGLVVALSVEFAALNQRAIAIQRDAFIDPLTKIMNRAGWNHVLLQMEALPPGSVAGAAVIMLDLDLLKEVNDSQGHSAGDDLLRLTANTIASVVRAEDIVARLGGDEFGVIVKNASPESADLLMVRLRAAFDVAKIGISMGAALQSEAGSSLQVTVQMADKRMYADKRTKSFAGKHYLDWMLGRVA